MTWAAGKSLITGGLVANLTEFYVFGSTDAGKNLVSGSTRSTTLGGSAAYGSDSIGTYVGMSGSGDYLEINNSAEASLGTSPVILLVWSREGASDGFDYYFEQTVSGGTGSTINLSSGFTVGAAASSYDPGVSDGAGVTGTSTEFAVVINYDTGKFFYTGGGSPGTFNTDSSATGSLGTLRIGNQSNTIFVAENKRFRAYARWTSQASQSDSDWQSIANNPQQLLTAAAPTSPSGVTASSVTYTTASISWTDNSSNESGFKVRYAPSPYSSYTTATASVAASPYIVTGLTDGTSYKAGVAAFNGNGDSTWVESGVFTTSTLSKLRPNADTSAGSWSASSGAVLYSMIDEASADDADYISATTATTTKIKFETSTDPADNSNHSLRIRARSTSGSLTVKLVQGDPAETTIVSWAPTLTSSFASYQYDLSTAEASVITDYSALYLKLTTS